MIDFIDKLEKDFDKGNITLGEQVEQVELEIRRLDTLSEEQLNVYKKIEGTIARLETYLVELKKSRCQTCDGSGVDRFTLSSYPDYVYDSCRSCGGSGVEK